MSTHREMKSSVTQFENASMDEKKPVNHVVPEFVDVDAETGDIDVAADALKGESLVFTDEEMRSVRNKIDWRIIPLAALGTGVQFLDKSGLGSAATYGMRSTLKLVGSDYSWCVSGFYFGYFAGAFISTRLLQRFHAGKVVGLSFIAWSATLLGMCGVHNFGGALALRVLLGVFESAFSPGLVLITTMWYTQDEQPFRFGLWNVMNGLMPIPFLPIYYALGHTHDAALVPWRLIFLLIGLLSFVTGVLLFFFLPDNPTSVSWLDHREKAIAVERVANSQTGIKNTHFKWYQAREALRDVRVWLLVGLMFTSQAVGSVTTNFLGIVINGFGFSPLKTQLLSMPNAAVQTVLTLTVTALPTFVPAFRNAKQLLLAGLMSVALAGTVILYQVTPHESNKNLRLGACIMLAFSGPVYGMILATIGTNIAGFTKKQFTIGMTFWAYCIIDIITPQTFLGSQSPRYHTGLAFVMAMTAFFVFLCLLSTGLMTLENIRRDRMALTDTRYATGSENLDMLSGLRDATDRENLHLRYRA